LRLSLIALTALALAGCREDAPTNAIDPVANATAVVPSIVGQPANNAAAPTATKALLNLAPDGLSLVDPQSGSARMITFETPRAATMTALQAVLGGPLPGKDRIECPVGPLLSAIFANGLEVYFQDDKFVGWDVNPGSGGLATAAGIGIGSTRRELEDVLAITVDPDSSLGVHFMAGSLMGILSSTAPSGKIEALWAGATCIAS
jgi:hypothetical protein